ncbi:MAG: winged helix-turn-helix transcriptional regulator [Candidatus Helarchaeota archaeon]
MEELDEIDIGILKKLQEDGRLSFNTIANELKISPPTVKYRIDKLKKVGLIQGFSVILDPNLIKDGFFAFILIEAKFQKATEILKTLKTIENIQELYLCLGKNNIIVKLFVTNNEELNQFLHNQLAQFNDIEKFEVITILQTVKQASNTKILRPGFGIRLFCDYCHKEIKDTPVKRTINDEEFRFCCNTCASVFKEKFSKEIT